jgi:geranylgeranyl diphosphate synthase type I
LTGYQEIVDAEYELVNEALEEYLDSRIEEVSRLGDVHRKYYGHVKEYMMRGGKRLRPILVSTGYKAIKERNEVKNLYLAACSVEFLHNGSLLHDDLIDNDETRRGGPTFHALYRDWYKNKVKDIEKKAQHFGMTMAIIGGDSLLNIGAQTITAANLPSEVSTKCLHYYQTAYQGLVDGVLLEMHMVGSHNPSPETYLEMIRLKTAILFENSLLIGAAIAGATDSQMNALSEFGVRVGQAFQIQDDILGSFGDEEVTGKPTEGDIREGKRTMLVLEAFRRAEPDTRERLEELLGTPDMSSEEVQEVKDIFVDTGALEAAKARMNELLDSGQDALDSATPAFDKDYKNFFIELSEFLVQRRY